MAEQFEKQTSSDKLTRLERSELRRNNWQARQSIVFVVAAMTAGAWGIFVYQMFDERGRAQAEFEEISRRISIARLEEEKEKHKEKAIVEVRIHASQEKVPGSEDRFINAIVIVTNKGNRNANVTFDEDPFTITHLNPDGTLDTNASRQYHPLWSKKTEGVEGLTVRVQETQRLAFFVKVDNPGVYLLEFDMKASPTIPPSPKPGYWSDMVYFVVK